jgi:hypothetical protein
MTLHWECFVDCWQAPSRKPDAKRTRTTQRFLLEAPDSEAAWSAAAEAGQARVPIMGGNVLLGIEVRQVSSVSLPYEVKP